MLDASREQDAVAIDPVLELDAQPGPLLFFGGPYGNLQALLRLREIGEGLGLSPSQIICTGDVVAYCAQPEETVQAIREWGVFVIAGNVELQLAAGSDVCGCGFAPGSTCDRLSGSWYPECVSRLSTASVDWMRSLPRLLRLDMGGKRIGVVHGSASEVAAYVFGSTPWSVKASELERAGCDVIVAGHCGVPFSHVEHGRLWTNAGVIGMPANEGIPRVWYLYVEPAPAGGLQLEHRWFTFDHERAAQLMEAAGMPLQYATTLRTGLWDNCDILPPAETRLRGQALDLPPLLLR